MTLKPLALVNLIILLAVAAPGTGRAAEVFPVRVLEERPHPAACYTQGLFWRDGLLYESCGLYGRSSFSRRPFPDGRTPGRPQSIELPAEIFAEGAAWAGEEIYLLSWREKRGFVLAPANLEVTREFTYEGEGWGLTWDGERLWRSDGSARLQPHRAGDFAPAGAAVEVRDAERGLTVDRLNELEWDGERRLILANIYGEDLVAAIDPGDGRVRFWLDARPLRALAVKAGLKEGADPMDTVLNGLALGEDGLWLTGKLWPGLYRIAWPPDGYEAEASAGDGR